MNGLGQYNDLFQITSSNVSISGFVLDGLNNAEDGISNYDNSENAVPVGNISIQGNVIQNFIASGISLDNGYPGPSPVTTGSIIQNNYVANNGASEPNNTGIGVYDNFVANIENNTIVVPSNFYPLTPGITVYNYDVPGGATLNISGNNITVGQGSAGIYINQIYSSGATVALSGNTIEAATGVTGTSGYTWGLAIKSISDSGVVNDTGDTIGTTGGQFSQGVNVYNTGSDNVTFEFHDDRQFDFGAGDRRQSEQLQPGLWPQHRTQFRFGHGRYRLWHQHRPGGGRRCQPVVEQ